MRITGVEAVIAHYREAGTKKDAHNRNCAQMGSAQLGVLLYIHLRNNSPELVQHAYITDLHVIYAWSESNKRCIARPNQIPSMSAGNSKIDYQPV